MKLTPREYDTIIAALRRHQWAVARQSVTEEAEKGLLYIASEHGRPLSYPEIDKLVAKIQFD